MQCHAVWFGTQCASKALEGDKFCYGDRVFVDKCDEIERKYGTYWCYRCNMAHSHDRDASLHS